MHPCALAALLYCLYCLPVPQIWVYGNSLESSLVAVVVPKKAFLEKYPDLGSPEASKAMLQVRQAGREGGRPGSPSMWVCLLGVAARLAGGWLPVWGWPALLNPSSAFSPLCLHCPAVPAAPAAAAAERGQGQQAQGLRGHQGGPPGGGAVQVRGTVRHGGVDAGGCCRAGNFKAVGRRLRRSKACFLTTRQPPITHSHTSLRLPSLPALFPAASTTT